MPQIAIAACVVAGLAEFLLWMYWYRDQPAVKLAVYSVLALYALGNALKLDDLGPMFLRNHLSAVGLPVLIATVICLPLDFLKRAPGLSGLGPLKHLRTRLDFRGAALIIGLGVAYAFEAFEGFAHSSSARKWASTGAGSNLDIINMAAYILGAGLALWFNNRAIRELGHRQTTEAYRLQFQPQFAQARHPSGGAVEAASPSSASPTGSGQPKAKRPYKRPPGTRPGGRI